MPRGNRRKVQQRHHKSPAAIPIHPTPKADTLQLRLKARLVLDNEDLLTEILLLLPAKSLTRFKCVCKTWLSIVSCDRFCHEHTLRWPELPPSPVLLLNHVGYFYFDPSTNGEKKMIPYINRSERLVPGCRILQVCNGLALLKYGDFNTTYTVYDATSERFLTYPKGCYCVYNLSTRRYRKIDLMYSGEDPSSRCNLNTSFAFDPSKSPYYKIVCIRCTGGSLRKKFSNYEIKVYESESHTWKLKLDTYTSRIILSPNGTYWNNGIYWTSGDGCCCFDVDTYEMKILGYPPETANSSSPPTLQESNGHLYCYMVESESVQVWELGKKGDDHEWLFKYNQVVRKGEILRLIGRSDGGGGEALLIEAGGKIWTYNFCDQTTDNNPLDFKTQPCHLLSDYPISTGLHFHFGETLALV